MKQIRIASDIVPVGEFKTTVSRWLKRLRENGRPVVITQNGKPAGVLVTPAEYDKLVYTNQFVESIERGIADADSGKVYSTKELKTKLAKNREAQSRT